MKSKRANIPDIAELQGAVEHLLSEDIISEDQAAILLRHMDGQFDQSGYILKNLGVHLSIGAIFAFDIIPLPLGTIGRMGWVCIARVAEIVKRNSEKARVHSLGVFLIAAIPWFGYAAYLLPLRKESKELAFVLANYTWRKRTGQTYEQFVDSKSNSLSRLARWIVPLPWQK